DQLTDDGTLDVCGEAVTQNDPLHARKLGIAAIYQPPALFPDLTVAENIALGLEAGGPWRTIHWRQRRRHATQLLMQIGARIDPDTDVRSLTMPEQQLVEIARALGARARVVIMDEPKASLCEREVEDVVRVVSGLRGLGGGVVGV